MMQVQDGRLCAYAGEPEELHLQGVNIDWTWGAVI